MSSLLCVAIPLMSCCTYTSWQGLFGEEGDGYLTDLQGMKTAVEWAWWSYPAATFATPVAIALLSVIACCCRVGRPALHSGASGANGTAAGL